MFKITRFVDVGADMKSDFISYLQFCSHGIGDRSAVRGELLADAAFGTFSNIPSAGLDAIKNIGTIINCPICLLLFFSR